MNGRDFWAGLRRLRSGLATRHRLDSPAEQQVHVPDAARVARVRPLLDLAFYRVRAASPAASASPEIAARHYLSEGAALGLSPNAFFDDGFYRAQLSDPLPPGMTPLEHYLERGARAGLDPSPSFSTSGYLRVNADVASADLNPLWHFLRWGAVGGRLPLPEDLSLCEVRVSRLLAEFPENLPALHTLGEIRLRQRRHTEALNLLERAESVEPCDDDNGRARLLNARALVATGMGRFREGIGLYREISRLAPHNTHIKHVIGQLLHLDGQLDGAELCLAEVAGLMGEDSPAAREHQFLSAESRSVAELATEARHAMAAGDRELALEIVKRAEVLRPGVESAIPGLRAAERAELNEGLLLLDNSFPSQGSSFRYGEFKSYLEQIPESRILTSTYHLSALAGAEPFLDQVQRYSDASGVGLDRIQSFHVGRDFSCSIAYCVFLNGAANFFSRPELKARRLAFTLYPGGGFGFNDAESDEKLHRLCNDDRLSKIITTQLPTHRYLVERKLCEPERLLHIFGVVVPAGFDGSLTASFAHLPRGAEGRLNICFVAHRYSPTGIEKGYDVFAALVRAMKDRSDVRFHVVGRFDPDTLDLNRACNITFHGVLTACAFPAFYSGMDIIVSPNISDARLNGGKGSFDGFPTTACVEAGLHGVAIFAADLEGMNTDLEGRAIFRPGQEMEVIDRDADRLVALVERYAADRDGLRRLAMLGRKALLREYSPEKQIAPRVALLRAEVEY